MIWGLIPYMISTLTVCQQVITLTFQSEILTKNKLQVMKRSGNRGWGVFSDVVSLNENVPGCTFKCYNVIRPRDSDLLRSHLVRSLVLVVDPAEVGHDDGHRQGDHQHAAEGADGAEDLPCDGVGNHVAVPAAKNTITSSANMLTSTSQTPIRSSSASTAGWKHTYWLMGNKMNTLCPLLVKNHLMKL